MRFNPWNSIADLPRGIWLTFAATLINRSGTMALPFLVLYLTQSHGFTPAQAGLAVAIYGLGSLVSGPLAGWICDRIGPLWVIQSSLLISGLLLATFPLAQSYAAILTLTFVWAFVGEAYRPASSAYLSDLVPSEQRKTAYALYRLAVNLGMSVGPLLGGLLASRVSYPALFWVDGATSVLAGVVFALAHRPPRPSSLPGVRSENCDSLLKAEQFSAWSDPRLLYFLASILLAAMVFFQFEGPLPLFMVRDLGLAESVYGAMFLINTLLIVFCEVPLNIATSGWPHQRLLALGAFLTALGFGGLTFATGTFGVAATIVIWTFGEMILMPGSVAYVA